MPLQSMAITRDEIGRNLAAVCFVSENPTFHNKIYLFLVNDDSGYEYKTVRNTLLPYRLSVS